MDWGWIGRNLDLIGNRTLEHLALAAPPIVIGFLISIPLGYWASRSRVARAILLTTGNILYTIPSIALLVLVPVALGRRILDPLNVVVALTIYAVALMLRVATDAFASVPTEVRSSAVAIGYSGIQRFFAVELPLAGPVLLAGVRVVSVSTVSLVTIGAVIGIESLGSFFTNAFQVSFPTEAYVALVLVLVIAAAFDQILSTIGRVLMPWRPQTVDLRARRIQRQAIGGTL
jgi:osmoprotectant transport system permease protein